MDSEGEDASELIGEPLQINKRSHHNALERKRRDHIKESFNGLRDSVPTLQGEKASRAQILNKATEYIQEMTKKNNEEKHDIEELQKQNIELEMRIRALEKAKNEGLLTGQVENLDQTLEDHGTL